MAAPNETLDLILAERAFLSCLARSLARQQADADDLVQETLIRALRAHTRLRPGSCLRAWLSTILTRVHRTLMRTRSRRATPSWTDAGLEPEQAWDAVAASDAAEERTDLAAIEEQLEDDLRRALRDLPDRMREPFCLHTLSGLPTAAIATRLGIAHGTVMSRIHRARARLRAALMPPPARRRPVLAGPRAASLRPAG